MNSKIDDFLLKIEKGKKKQSSLYRYIDEIFYLRDIKGCSFGQTKSFLLEYHKVDISSKTICWFYNKNKNTYSKETVKVAEKPIQLVEKVVENKSSSTSKPLDITPKKEDKKEEITTKNQEEKVVDLENKTDYDIYFTIEDLEEITKNENLDSSAKIKELEKFRNKLNGYYSKNILHWKEIKLMNLTDEEIYKLKNPNEKKWQPGDKF